MYLKTQGIDPKSHPVIAELVRSSARPLSRSPASCQLRPVLNNTLIKYLLLKGTLMPKKNVRPVLQSLTTPLTQPSTAKTSIDKDAATRFITHAITQAQSQPRGQGSSSVPGPSTFVPAKITTKIREREEYRKELQTLDDDGEEEDDLEIIDDEAPPAKGKGGAKRKHTNGSPKFNATSSSKLSLIPKNPDHRSTNLLPKVKPLSMLPTSPLH